MPQPVQHVVHPPLLSLPDDVLSRIVELLALQANDSPAAAVDALTALSICSNGCALLLEQTNVWTSAASALQFDHLHHFSAHEMLVRATAAAEVAIDRHSIASVSSSLHALQTPRTGGWLARTVGQLEPLGLVYSMSTLESEEATEDLPCNVPFLIVQCDAADSETRPSVAVSGNLLTYPCADPRCMEPAAGGCRHCGKHGGRGARQCVERLARHLALPSTSTRHVIFSAQSPAVKEAYRKAILQQSRGRDAPRARKPTSVCV